MYGVLPTLQKAAICALECTECCLHYRRQLSALTLRRDADGRFLEVLRHGESMDCGLATVCRHVCVRLSTRMCVPEGRAAYKRYIFVCAGAGAGACVYLLRVLQLVQAHHKTTRVGVRALYVRPGVSRSFAPL
jgi:hypothetical protein